MACGGSVLVQNEHELEGTRQRIIAFQDALMALRRNQLPNNYAQIAQNFLYEIKRWKQKRTNIYSAVPRLKTMP